MGCCGSKKQNVADTMAQKKNPTLAGANYVENDKPWVKVQVPRKVKVNLHEHEILQMADCNDDTWACDGMNLFRTGCHNGITDYYQTKGIWGWECPDEECDFQICKACVQYSMYVEQEKTNLTHKAVAQATGKAGAHPPARTGATPTRAK